MKLLLATVLLGCGHSTQPSPPPANTAPRAIDAAALPARSGIEILGVEIDGSAVFVDAAAGTTDGLDRHSTGWLRARDGQDLGPLQIVRVEKHRSRWKTLASAAEARNAEVVVGP